MTSEVTTNVNDECSREETVDPIKVGMRDLLSESQAMDGVEALRADGGSPVALFEFLEGKIALLDGGKTPSESHEQDLFALAKQIEKAGAPGSAMLGGTTVIMGRPINLRYRGKSYPKGALIVAPPEHLLHHQQACKHVVKFVADVLSEKISSAFAHRHSLRQREMAENELQIQYEKMLAVMEEKECFFRSVSHELRSPLTSIIGFVELVQESDEPLTARQNSAMARIADNARRLLDLVNNLLDLGKLEARRMEVDSKPVRLHELVQRVVDNLTPLASEKDLVLSTSLALDVPEIVTDEQKVVHILVNLISNAIKFTNEGSIGVSTSINCESVKIAVSDTGIGIPLDQRRLIFQEFYRVPGNGKAQCGSGLGLAIAQKMAVLLGGSITVESEPGMGSTFTVDLPIRKN